MAPICNNKRAKWTPSVFGPSKILPSVFLLLLAGATGHLTYFEAMTAQDGMEARQLEDFYDQDDQAPEDHDGEQELDLNSLQDILDYNVPVEGEVEEEENPDIRQFALMISRMLFQLARE